MNMNECYRLYYKAHTAGMDAGKAVQCTPMVVQQRANPLNDNSQVVKSWLIPDGVCGFASIRMAGNTSFAKWIVQERHGMKGYPKGVSIFVDEFGQSLQRKEAYASAFAKVLNEAGIKAYPESRID